MLRTINARICRRIGSGRERGSTWELHAAKRTLANFASTQYDYRSPLRDIKDKLERFNVPHADGYTCYVAKDCTVCSTPAPGGNKSAFLSKKPKLFVNKRTGHFLCNRCKISGSWRDFNALLRCRARNEEAHVADSVKDGCFKYEMTLTWQKILNQCDSLCSLTDEDYDKVFADFKLPACSRQQMESLSVRVNRQRNVLFFPIFYSDSVVGYKTLESSGDGTTFPKSDCPGCVSSSKGGKQAIVVASLRDFIALLSLNLSSRVLCLPYGAASLPQNLLPGLEEYDKVIFWLGQEWGAWHASLQFAKKLNEKRCFVIPSTENQSSAAAAITSGENVDGIILDAKPLWHQFVTTFSSFRKEVLAEIQNEKQVCGVQWMRFPALNHVLKGHRRGELTILTGPTGCGKTTFISEYSLDLAMRGVNTLWGSFEIKNSRLAHTMLQQFSGLASLSDEKLFNIWADKFEELPIYFVTLHGQNSIETVMDAVEHCSYVYDIAHVIIDNIQFMIDVSVDAKFSDRFLVQDRVVQSFRRFATLNNCHVTLVMHPRKELEGTELGMSSIFGTAKAAQEADNVLILQKKGSGVEKNINYLEICKNRFTGDLGSIPLKFDKSCLRFSDGIQTLASDGALGQKRYKI